MQATLYITKLGEQDGRIVEDITLDCAHYNSGITSARDPDYTLTPKDKRILALFIKKAQGVIDEPCDCMI